MAVLDTISNYLIGLITGFITGLFLHQKLKDYIFYKFIKSPVDIYSEHHDLGFGKEVLGILEDNFTDEITLTNTSDFPIRIKNIIVEIKSKGKKIKSPCAVFWDSNPNEFFKELNRRKENMTMISDTIQYSKRSLSKDLKPKDSFNSTLGLLFKKGLKNFRITVEVYPNYEYKKTSLIYNLVINS